MSAKVNQIVTDRIVRILEGGKVPWRRTWDSPGGMPKSFSSGRNYRGVNVFLLGFAPFDSSFWVTSKGAKKAGGGVRPDQWGEYYPAIYWKEIVKNEGTPDESRYGFLRFFRLYNLDQTEGLEAPDLSSMAGPREDASPIEAAEEIVRRYVDAGGPRVLRGGYRPCYVPPADEVRVPDLETFHSDADHYSTLFHELAHSTGVESRLGRYSSTEQQKFGGGEYSREELVAEMTASFLSAHAGIGEATIENAAAYIQSWIGVLKADPSAAVFAGRKAQAAADYILGPTPEEPPRGEKGEQV